MIVKNRIEVRESASHQVVLDKLRETLRRHWADWEPIPPIALSRSRNPTVWVARITVQQEIEL